MEFIEIDGSHVNPNAIAYIATKAQITSHGSAKLATLHFTGGQFLDTSLTVEAVLEKLANASRSVAANATPESSG